jgi:hypothetical protein
MIYHGGKLRQTLAPSPSVRAGVPILTKAV